MKNNICENPCPSVANQNIAIIGGGINGIMTARELVKLGHSVTLYEKGEVMKQTSSASSKLLHGGLRYLENFEFRLVKEALKERQWWISQAPQLAHPLKLYIPIYKTNRRPAWMYKVGLWLYDLLAGKQNIGQHQSLTKQKMHQVCPELKTENLVKGFCYYDGQMDDHQLGLWALEQAKQASQGCTQTSTDNQTQKTISENPCPSVAKNNMGKLIVKEHTEVIKLDPQGNLTLADGTILTFDKIINIAGPWAEQLLKQSDIQHKYNLDLIRGSHIIVDTNSDGSTQTNTDNQSQKNIRENPSSSVAKEKEIGHGYTQTSTDSKESSHCEERSDAAISTAHQVNPCSSVANDHETNQGYLLEIPNERRIVFVLPYQGKTLIGTTEQRQTLDDNIQPSEQESDYLINAYNHYFKTPIGKQNIVQSFAGLRPLIKSADNPNKATREYAIQSNGNVITVFGGKWTTARQLAKNVTKKALV